MELAYWIMFGAFASLLAKMQFPAKREENIFVLLAVGCIGAVLGGFIMNSIGRAGATSTAILCYVAAFLGAALFLVVQRSIFSQRPA